MGCGSSKEDRAYQPTVPAEQAAESSNAPIPRETRVFKLQTLTGHRCFGPWLKYNAFNPVSQELMLSVLVVCDNNENATVPTLQLLDGTAVATIPAVRLDSWGSFSFFRFQIGTTLGVHAKVVKYQVQLPATQQHKGRVEDQRQFAVPAANAPWHWMFCSCNGFEDPEADERYGGIGHLWTDILKQHSTSPFHALVGGGDQIYNDLVFQTPSLKDWPYIRDYTTEIRTQFTTEMKAEVEEFYFSHYAYHFSDGPYAEALATIPSINVWDDHDIFDGWGSYAPDLQSCPIMQGVYAIARRFYLLFQQHTTDGRTNQDDANQFFGTQTALHQLAFFGQHVALLALDTRSERTLTQVVHPTDWDLIFQRIQDLPSSVHHLVVLTPIPVVYPEVEGLATKVEATTEALGEANWLPHRLHREICTFNQVSFQDDIQDAWTSTHQEEVQLLVAKLQAIANSKALRVTFLSGDVHVSSISMLTPKDIDMERPHALKKEPRFITQVTSSAIGNTPPPQFVVAMYAESGDDTWDFNEGMEANFVRILEDSWAGKGLLGATRNWCEVQEAEYAGTESFSEMDGHLRFTLRFEDCGYDADHSKSTIETFSQVVPVVDKSLA